MLTSAKCCPFLNDHISMIGENTFSGFHRKEALYVYLMLRKFHYEENFPTWPIEGKFMGPEMFSQSPFQKFVALFWVLGYSYMVLNAIFGFPAPDLPRTHLSINRID